MKTLQTKIFDTDGNIYYSPKSLAVFSEGMAEIVKDKKQDCTIRVIKINSKNQWDEVDIKFLSIHRISRLTDG